VIVLVERQASDSCAEFPEALRTLDDSGSYSTHLTHYVLDLHEDVGRMTFLADQQ